MGQDDRSVGFTVLGGVPTDVSAATDEAVLLAQRRRICICASAAAPGAGRQRIIAGLLVGVALLACLVHWSHDGSGGGTGPAAVDGADFAIMLDAGSSGTRVHVYSWPVGSSCAVRIAQREVIEHGNGLKVKPGLSKQAPVHVADYLQPLLNFAKGIVPPERHAATSVYLQATAGLRLLPQPEQNALINAVWETFKASPFRSDSEANAAVISGKAEGVNEWVTVNYLRGTLGGASNTGCCHSPGGAISNLTKGSATAVTLGMGGASTQIVFAPDANSDCPLEDPSTAFCVAFQGDSQMFGLYAHSYLGLGATEAQDTLRKGIVSVDGGGSPAAPVGDACLLVGYTTTAQVNGKSVAFSGQGDYAACKQSIVTHVVQTQHSCRWKHCAFNGVFQPKLTAGDLHLNREFFELSAFVFTAQFFGMKEGDQLKVLQDHGQDFCAMSWADARTHYPEADEALLANYCFLSSYFVVLLQAYGVDSDRTSLRWADMIDGVSLDWPLGAVIRSTCAMVDVGNSSRCRGRR